MPLTLDLLNLHGIGQRASSYRFDLLDNTERIIGELHPARDELTATITHDSSRGVARDLANLTLTPVDTAAINPFSDRVRPIMILEDGSEHPLGIFLFGDASHPRRSYGETTTGTLVDKGLILSQPIDRTVGVSSNEDVRSVALRLLADLGLEAVVESTVEDVGAPMAWPAGTSAWQVLADLGTNVGWAPPWFDHLGVCRVQPLPGPTEHEPEVAYDRNVYAESPISTNDLLHAVNRTIAISSDSENQAFVGIYDVPASAPHSFHARGFRVVEVFNVEGIGSQRQIDEAARNLHLTTGAHRTTEMYVEHLSFDGPPDPRHDGYTIVAYDERSWLEENWTLVLSPVGPMSHTLRSSLDCGCPH